MKQPTLFLIFFLLLPFFSQSQVNGRYYFERKDSIEVIKNGQNMENPWVGGMNSIQVSKIHLNNDGDEDLLIFDRTGNTILTFIWDGVNNKWSFQPQYAKRFPHLEYWVLLRDYNCDGKKDIFSYVSGGIGVWKNISTAAGLEFEFVSDPYVFSSLLGGTVANLYVSKVDIPDINDVDGDGDLDVLTFGIIGSRMEYHQNLSMELGFGCDSLKFETANTCWGHFLETGFATNKCILYDTCTSNVSSPKGVKHSGSTVLSLDMNNDGVRDLLLGDVSFKNIVALYNDNKGPNMNTSMVSQDTAFPTGTQAVDLQLFPASFYEDVDQDGVRDLIFSPNTDNEAENFKSSWLYKNYGTNSSPVFAHIKNDWMQDEMIEVGDNAHPVLFDYNNDGLLDLFVGNFGYFDLGFVDNYESKIALFENTGTVSTPEFTWITDDFGNLSTMGLGQGLSPTFGDLDNDGDIDMIVGNHEGKLAYLENSSNTLSAMTLSLSIAQLEDDNAAVIDVGYAAKPQLFDINADGLLDLIIGEENATLNYLKNIGTSTNPLFRIQDESLGDVDVSVWWTTVGNSSPCFFRNNQGVTQSFVGSERGQIFHYNNIDNNLQGSFNIVDTLVSLINVGTNSSPTIGMLNNDTIPDLIVGNERGGLSIFYGTSDNSISVNEIQKNELSIYPNPAKELINVKSNELILTYEVIDTFGKTVISGGQTNQIQINKLAQGIYLIKIHTPSQTMIRKFIKE